MDMERVMEFLLVFEEKMDASHEKMLAKMAFFHGKIDVRNAELDAHHEKMIASQEWTITKMNIWLAEMKEGRKEMTACQEVMEANPDEMKSLTVHEEVFKEEARVKSSGALKKWLGIGIWQ
jgi:hypothetical protein